MHPASNAPSPREPAQQVAWNAYLRLAVRAILPPFLYWWLARHRRVSPLELTDSVLTQDATDESTYFIALCTPK